MERRLLDPNWALDHSTDKVFFGRGKCLSRNDRMSALGQKQTLEHRSRMSAFLSRADILRGGSDVR